ncbi:pyridoxal phosphate-dependent aminotransferase [Pseudolysobacter antarcticus]|uniref:Pyridoxal phosphate-dependent aminotransferase n=1 Tax=Pseudolysobacter antarcticus TaxID=2511995 RepID=A0A411HIU9_9GAMM|nr:pyridoxal phosphate-dependent aminotransferase [Pseudolysobacter antarcticus]QBB70320.1 pyridoxal phosphate-dependent aminotransferase [Pseudolysobacter antarcticus]
MQIETKLPKVGTTIFTVMSQLALQHKAINLGQGFPDFEGPQALRDALTEHMNSGKNQYAMMTGIPRLREQIALKTEKLYGHKANIDTEITVTSGATEAIFAAIAATVRAGEEVIVLDPCYDCYEPAIDLAGARAVHVPLDPQTFAVDWDRVKAAITPKTRMLMVNSPHNPCGSVFSAADLDALAEITRNTRILILSDEVYEHIVFDGLPHQSVLRRPELAARSFVISSFGKTYHCTGWKVGYCIAPAALSVEFRKVHQYLTFCTFTPAQWALADIMESDPQHYLDLPKFYEDRRDNFRQLLAGSRFVLPKVGGAYFQLADYSAISDMDDLNFCEWLAREGGVAAIPLSAFYETPPASKLIRLCFAKSDATLQAAAERLCKI